jgi:methylase of polypeptide subunit release factors
MPPAATAVLREVLTRASYDADSVRDLVRADGLDMLPGLAVLRLRPEGDEPLVRLVRLFLGGEDLDAGAAAAALEPAQLGDLIEAGLVEPAGEGAVRASVRLDPVRGLLVAADHRRPGPSPGDHVVYPGPASETLAALTVRDRVESALDLCCGSGIQALLAARHSERVVATDLNDRALRLAELSADLSGVRNVEWRSGDLFEPVGDERFELIVANPPFVISPSTELTYRDGGRSGDELSREVVAGCAERLEEGGFGHVLCSWVRGPGAHYSDAPWRWLADAGCDVIVLHIDTETPVGYAMRWNMGEAGSADEAVQGTRRWQDYYAELGIESLATGVVVFRRRPGPNWLYADELVTSGDDAGAHVRRVFGGHDAVAAFASDGDLPAARLSLPPSVRLIERRLPGGRLERARLSDGDGLRLPGAITPPSAAAALTALDGRRTLAAAGDAAGVPPGDLEAALPSIRDLIRRGYVVVGASP